VLVRRRHLYCCIVNFIFVAAGVRSTSVTPLPSRIFPSNWTVTLVVNITLTVCVTLKTVVYYRRTIRCTLNAIEELWRWTACDRTNVGMVGTRMGQDVPVQLCDVLFHQRTLLNRISAKVVLASKVLHASVARHHSTF